MTALRISDLGMTFDGKAGRLVALDGITLDVEPGEFVSLIGPSGCGKSTLLRLIGDLLSPTAGAISVNAKSPRQARLDRDYGMVFQKATLLDWRTVADNIRLPLEVMGFSRTERNRRTKSNLELVQLDEFADLHPWQLSGGMQQRVAIARALAFEPSLLLMDEPFGALDEMTRERMQMELMRIWSRTGITVVFVTHSIPEAVFLSTRVVVMSPRPGQITDIVPIGLGQPREFATRKEERFFELITAVREKLRGIEQSGDQP